MAVDAGLTAKDDDPGQFAGDESMSIFTLRQVETKQNDLYGLGVHTAAMADLITTVLRSGGPWARPENVRLGEQAWESGAWLDPSGVRLHRVVIADRLTPERLEAEKHSWRQLGEVCVYGLPMTVKFVTIGQQREGRHASPWSKGWLHPVGNRTLRFKKRDGTGLSGKGWKPIFREDVDQFSRDFWLDAMRTDGVMTDLMFDVEIPVPPKEAVVKIRKLAERKLERIYSTKETPEPQPSQCWGLTTCQFVNVCWQFRKEPTERDGFIRLR